jgi:zinc transport system substrate-binding protein
MKYFINFFILLVLIFFSACSKDVKKNDNTIVVSTFAIYDIVSHIAKKNFSVYMLIEPGKEIHEYEPTPKDVVRLKNASLFIYSGAGLEPWVEKFKQYPKKSLDLSKFVKLKKADHHHNHTHSAYDPHYWLDFSNMKIATKVITKELIALMPTKKDIFIKNEKQYLKMLDNLDVEFKKELLACKKDTIVVNHNAYGYLAKRYGFKIESLVGLSPEAQPNPKIIQNSLKEIKSKGIKVLFSEAFENNSVLKSIAKDAKVTIDTLQPLANLTNDEAKKNLTYKDIMLQNLKKLKNALECNGI